MSVTTGVSIEQANARETKSEHELSGSSGWSLNPGFSGIKQLGVGISTPLSIKFAGMHLCTWTGRGTVRARCLAMSPARNQTRIALSENEHTNRESDAHLPPSLMRETCKRNIFIIEFKITSFLFPLHHFLFLTHHWTYISHHLIKPLLSVAPQVLHLARKQQRK